MLVQYECIFKVNFRLEKKHLSHLTSEEKLGHMEQKEDLEDLVGACAILNKNSQ